MLVIAGVSDFPEQAMNFLILAVKPFAVSIVFNRVHLRRSFRFCKTSHLPHDNSKSTCCPLRPSEKTALLNGKFNRAVFVIYSHSIVAGGFPVQSYSTRFTCWTSFTIRLETLPITSQGSSAASAVIKSMVFTARSAMA